MEFPILEQPNVKHSLSIFVCAKSNYKPYCNAIKNNVYKNSNKEEIRESYKNKVKNDYSEFAKNIDFTDSLKDFFEFITDVFSSKIEKVFEEQAKQQL